MALLQSEVWRLKAELGYNVLNVTASPYIGISSLVEQVIVPALTAGTITTSSTSVQASTDPTVRPVTLASATGFEVGQVIVLDVDDAQETATAQSLSGSTVSVRLSLAHSGTYPVTVEGPESIIREDLKRIRAVKRELAATFGEGALKKVDEVEFYQLPQGQSRFDLLGQELMFWRDELCSHLGIANPWRMRGAAGGRLSVY